MYFLVEKYPKGKLREQILHFYLAVLKNYRQTLCDLH